MEIELKRPIQMERCEVIGRLHIEQERLDLKMILERMQSNQISEIPKRLEDLFDKLKIYKSGNVLDAGKNLLEKGTIIAEEYGHYEIWYLRNDAWLASRPMIIRRIEARNKKDNHQKQNNSNKWQHEIASDWQVMSEQKGPVLVQFAKDKQLHNLPSLKVDALLSQQNHETGTLKCKLSSAENAKLELTAQIKWNHENIPDEVLINMEWDAGKIHELLPEMAEQLGRKWDEVYGALLEDSPPENLTEVMNFIRKNVVISNLHTKSAGIFDSIEIKDVPLRASSKRCAEKWLIKLMVNEWAKNYTPVQLCFEDQKEWINNVALKDYDLQILEDEELLNSIGRDTGGMAYWHVAALQDLVPSGVDIKPLPFTIRKSDENPIINIGYRLGNREPIYELRVIDRYIKRDNQIQLIQKICRILRAKNVGIVTLERPNNLPNNWNYIKMGAKIPENHDRYWCINKNNDWQIWKCSTSPDFIDFKDDFESIISPATFTPLDAKDVPNEIRKFLDDEQEVVE
ncbi:MAG: hypothetical protein SCH39_07500 [Methanosarcinales archaeon]|nr:hypothetical protein [Methanosarcinales archaeon]